MPFSIWSRVSSLDVAHIVVYTTIVMPPKLPTAEQTFRQVPCFCGVLLIAARSVSRLYNDELRSVGLEATQHSMLTVLKHLGRMTMGDLGERLAVDKTT